MKVIIAGSRHISDAEALKTQIENTGWDIEEVVSGGCRGVDVMGEEWAQEKGIPVRTFVAHWEEYGREAGELRNREMAEYADGLILLWDAKSPGSSCMLRESAKAGILINHSVHGLGIADIGSVERAILEHFLAGKGRLVLQHGHWEWETADPDAPAVCQEAVSALIKQDMLEEATLTILRQPHSGLHSTYA
jgi:hypothetical protein